MTVSTPELKQCQDACRTYRRKATALTFIGLALLVALQQIPAGSVLLVGRQIEYRELYTALIAAICIASALTWAIYAFHWIRQRGYENTLVELNAALKSQDLPFVQETVNTIRGQAQNNPLIESALQTLQSALNQHLDDLTRQQSYEQLESEVAKATRDCDQQLAAIRKRTPLVIAETTVRESLTGLQQRRKALDLQWQETYRKLSWWNQLKYAVGPDFKEMDKAISQLKFMHQRLLAKHADDFRRLDSHLAELKSRAQSRVFRCQQQIKNFIASDVSREKAATPSLQAALWLSAFSVPVSAWADVSTAGDIYEALRKVNGNYAGMSDAEIWWETLFMPAEQLAGLASLTKGAYLEQLVAADTGGSLFEHFNNPGTDIIIDGQAFQIKATASAAYINSVDENIPVIATSEVAEQTRAIDSGFSNADLEHSVDLALDGSVVDVKDTTVDALLSGVGGLGFFATVQGINHAAQRYENGGDGVEAVFEGLGVAIEGTARALVGTAELGYKVLTSRPSRFVGRTLLAGAKKLDDKLFGG